MIILLLLGSVIFRCARFGSEEAKDPFHYIYTVYLLLFMFMLFIADIKLARILYFFSFLSPWLGKGVFIILIGLMLFDWNHIFEFITCLICIIVGVIYIIYGFRFDDWIKEDEDA